MVRAQWDAQVRALCELPVGGGGEGGARHGHQHRRQHQRAHHVPELRLPLRRGLHQVPLPVHREGRGEKADYSLGGAPWIC